MLAVPSRDPAEEVTDMSISEEPRKGPPLSNQLKALQAQAAHVSGGQLAALVLADQRQRWAKGERVLVEVYLAQLPALKSNSEALLDFIYGEVLLREEHGEAPQVDEYLQRFPELDAPLQRQFVVHEAVRPSDPELSASQQETRPPRAEQDTRKSPPPQSAAVVLGRSDDLPSGLAATASRSCSVGRHGGSLPGA